MKVTTVISTTIVDTIETKEVTFRYNYTTSEAPTQVDFYCAYDQIQLSGTVYAKELELRYSVSGGTVSKALMDAILEKASSFITNYETIK